jgi:hypothetical protein
MSSQPIRAASHPQNSWRRVIAALFFCSFLAFQLVFPAWQLITQPQPAKFSWQMYAIVNRLPTFTLVYPDGTQQAITLQDYTASYRTDTPFERFLPPALCERHPTIRAVQYQRAGDSQPTEVVCTR